MPVRIRRASAGLAAVPVGRGTSGSSGVAPNTTGPEAGIPTPTPGDGSVKYPKELTTPARIPRISGSNKKFELPSERFSPWIFKRFPPSSILDDEMVVSDHCSRVASPPCEVDHESNVRVVGAPYAAIGSASLFRKTAHPSDHLHGRSQIRADHFSREWGLFLCHSHLSRLVTSYPLNT